MTPGPGTRRCLFHWECETGTDEFSREWLHALSKYLDSFQPIRKNMFFKTATTPPGLTALKNLEFRFVIRKMTYIQLNNGIHHLSEKISFFKIRPSTRRHIRIRLFFSDPDLPCFKSENWYFCDQITEVLEGTVSKLSFILSFHGFISTLSPAWLVNP